MVQIDSLSREFWRFNLGERVISLEAHVKSIQV